MYLADCHTHSRVSPDAGASMTELAEAAAAAGLDEICFTDHVEPIVWGSTRLRDAYDWRALESEFREAQDAVGDRIALRLGSRAVTVEVLSVQETVRQADPNAFMIVTNAHEVLGEGFGSYHGNGL